jgi:hypothetical protein
VSVSEPERGPSERRRLAWECANTSREILDLVHEYERAERAGWQRGIEQKRAALDDERQTGTDSFTTLMQNFETRFSARVLYLFDEARRLGVLETSERFVFEHPTNTHGIHEIAQKLGVARERLAPGERFEASPSSNEIESKKRPLN